MKLKIIFIILVKIFLIVLVVIYFINVNKKPIKKKNIQTIRKETKIDTFFQIEHKEKATIDEIEDSYNTYVIDKKSQNKTPLNHKAKRIYKSMEKLPKATIKKQMAAIESPIRFEYNDIVDGFIDKYAFKQKYHTAKLMGLAEYYFPMFEEALHEKKLPLELKYLPVIESALQCNAVSNVGATGIWQLMFPTAEAYSLTISCLLYTSPSPRDS